MCVDRRDRWEGRAPAGLSPRSRMLAGAGESWLLWEVVQGRVGLEAPGMAGSQGGRDWGSQLWAAGLCFPPGRRREGALVPDHTYGHCTREKMDEGL